MIKPNIIVLGLEIIPEQTIMEYGDLLDGFQEEYDEDIVVTRFIGGKIGEIDKETIYPDELVVQI